jgi:hypothetical protein
MEFRLQTKDARQKGIRRLVAGLLGFDIRILITFREDFVVSGYVP